MEMREFQLTFLRCTYVNLHVHGTLWLYDTSTAWSFNSTALKGVIRPEVEQGRSSKVNNVSQENTLCGAMFLKASEHINH